MSEEIDLYNHLGEKTGEIKERDLVHRDGDWHASVHLWIFDEKKRILLQKRSSRKKLYPSMWVAPVSGHVSAGASNIETLIRETSEEVGVNIRKEDVFLHAIVRGSFKDKSINLDEKEYIHIYITTNTIDIDLDTVNDEVDGFKWFEYHEFKELVDNKDVSLVPAYEEYEVILAYLKHN